MMGGRGVAMDIATPSGHLYIANIQSTSSTLVANLSSKSTTIPLSPTLAA